MAQDGFDVSGLDISDSMLTQAKEKYSKTKNLKGQAEFSKADLRYFDLKKKYSAEPFLKLKFNNNLLKTFSTLNLFQLL
ncbi:MAG: hypothetical protein MGG11_20615 [Trichodesmium sp. MAG_R03]|nr:hypothetical protein [Trichodesmium sp. MAG_R03]